MRWPARGRVLAPPAVRRVVISMFVFLTEAHWVILKAFAKAGALDQVAAVARLAKQRRLTRGPRTLSLGSKRETF